jgi:hypothetical protein
MEYRRLSILSPMIIPEIYKGSSSRGADPFRAGRGCLGEYFDMGH